MHYDYTVFAYQYSLVSDFVKHLAYRNTLNEAYIKHSVESEIWCATINAHFMAATLYWCKVFGSDGANQTHWKNLATIDTSRLQDSFRECIYGGTGLTATEWKDFFDQMCNFRNKFVAHNEIGYSDPIPYFENALRIAFAYDKWVRDLINPDVVGSPMLKFEYERWQNEAKQDAIPYMLGIK